MKTSVTLRYEGPALDAGRMDAYEASANMIAFSEFMVAAVKATYGDAADTKAEVRGFERGSFQTMKRPPDAGADHTVAPTGQPAILH